jgi:hypothetical protein
LFTTICPSAVLAAGHVLACAAGSPAAPSNQQQQGSSAEPAVHLQELAGSAAAVWCCKPVHQHRFQRAALFQRDGITLEDSAAWQSQAAEVLTLRIQELSRFADWLLQHSGLVGQLGMKQLKFPKCIAQCSQHLIQQLEEAEQLLAAALQAAAAKPAASAASPAAAATAAAVPQLQLHSFTGDSLNSAALLHALPAAALTRLELTGISRGLDMNSRSAAAALARLSNLRMLKLFGGLCHPFSDTCLAAVGQLKQLTELHLHEAADTCNFQLLPQQLQQLYLTLERDYAGEGSGSVSSAQLALGHLSVLQRLDVFVINTTATSPLPTSLTSLTFNNIFWDGPACSLQRFSLPALQQLQRLDITHTAGHLLEPEDAAALVAISTALSSLTHIALDASLPSRFVLRQPGCTFLP